MIFTRFGKHLERIENNSWIMDSRSSPWVKFIRCFFCLCPWLVLVLELFYILEFSPGWLFAVIGVLGGLGSGNLVCEIVHCLRNEE